MQQQIKTLSFKILLLFLFAGCLLSHYDTYGQTKVNTDSIRIARQKNIEAERLARQKSIDSARAVRQKAAEILKDRRKAFADSMAAIRNYRSSKHYKDSVSAARKARLDSIKAVRTAYFDSLRTARKKITDSIVAVRKRTTDSIRATQKHRSDSLMAIRKYRSSKRYKDSVIVVRHLIQDSTNAARKAISDAIVSKRKHTADSATAARKAITEKLKAERKKIADSIQTVRKARAEELAKAKAKREGLEKSRQKKKEDKMKLALELKIKKKRQAWSNEKMLKKKWSKPRRVIQNTFTHYNYYYNANRKMDEAMANVQLIKKDNYDSLLTLLAFDPDKDSTRLLADMDSVIQKTSLGIQIHDPRTKWAGDLYLLMGEAYYYKGNYDEAIASFKYIISMNQKKKADEIKKAASKKKKVEKDNSVVEEDKNNLLDFLKHKSVNNEAILWLARVYTQAHQEDEAESILDLLQSDSKFPEDLKGRLALEKAYLNIKRDNYKEVAKLLPTVINDDNLPQWQRLRAAYLNGQISYDQGNYKEAAKNFDQVIDMHPKIEMDFYARKNLAYSLIAEGGSQESATVSLKKLLNDGKYSSYEEQIYYVLGRLSMNNNNPNDAIKYFKKGAASIKSTRKQKAFTFASLGDVYYNLKDYKEAKSAYDSCASFARAAPKDSIIQRGEKRAIVLHKVTGPLQIIHDEDSLLALAALGDKEQRAIIRKYIRNLEKEREDSINKVENGLITPKATGTENGDPGTVGNWYFSSTELMQQGYNDFKTKWGNRKNVDNWRRVGGTAIANTSGDNNDIDDGTTSQVNDNGLPSEASLLAAIPNSKEEKNTAILKTQKAFIDLANAYYKDLDDYSSCLETLDTLDKRYANHDHQAEDIFLRYKVALKQNRLDDAKKYSDKILNDYSKTQWAEDVMPSPDKNGSADNTNGVSVANYYDLTYSMLMQRQYTDVLDRVKTAQKIYREPVYKNRFSIMEAIALAGSGNYNQADSLLKNFISTHPSDSLKSWAETILTYVKKNKPVPTVPLTKPTDSTSKHSTQAPPQASTVSKNPYAPPSAKLLSNTDSTNGLNQKPGVITPAPNNYTYKPQEEHFFIFNFKKMESKALGVKAALNDFNTFNYTSQKLASSIDMLQPTQGIIVIKSFPSATHAKIYMNAIRGNNLLLKEYQPNEYQLMIISADNYKKLMVDRDLTPYIKFYKANYK